MSNRFDDKFSKEKIKKDVIKVNDKTSVADSIINAGKPLDLNSFNIKIKPKNISKSYYMRADIHEKIKEYADGNAVGASEFLEMLLKEVFGIHD